MAATRTGAPASRASGPASRASGPASRASGPASRASGSTPRTSGSAPRPAGASPRTSGSAPRRTLTAREAAALREALAARAAAVGSPVTATTLPTTPAAARPAPGTRRTGTGRPAAGGTPARRTPARSAAARKAAAREAREVRKAAHRALLRRWSRHTAVLGLAALVVPAVVAVLLPASPASAPGTGTDDATALALTAQTGLLSSAAEYRRLEQTVAQRRSELARAEAALGTAQAAADTERQTVGASAADLYRATATERYPLLGLDVTDPGATAEALYLAAVSDRDDEELQGAVVRAERGADAVARAQGHVAQARTALTAATHRADGALAAVRRRAGALSPAVTSTLAGLGVTVSTGAQRDRDQQALRRWQGYLAALAAADIHPPAAAELADPQNLPAGMSSALDAAGQPIPGVAWAIVGTSPVTVLPAETVAAVSTALAQLGKPYVAGASGPDSYDCGGLTAASWMLGGYALPLSPADQWVTGTAVPAGQLQVGDLVVTDGGLDAGIYLGNGDVLGASASGFAVAVRPMGADARAVRVTLGAPAQAGAPLVPAAGMGACGAPLPEPGPTDPAWGGYANGRIPASALCPLGVGSHVLRCDAAASYRALSDAFAAAFGSPLCITDSYRSYAAQVTAYRAKPWLAAWPGTSNHGWALAVDLCGGINVAGSPQWTWMQANAGRFGFVNPVWARPGGEKPEPWHWEYGVFQ